MRGDFNTPRNPGPLGRVRGIRLCLKFLLEIWVRSHELDAKPWSLVPNRPIQAISLFRHQTSYKFSLIHESTGDNRPTPIRARAKETGADVESSTRLSFYRTLFTRIAYLSIAETKTVLGFFGFPGSLQSASLGKLGRLLIRVLYLEWEGWIAKCVKNDFWASTCNKLYGIYFVTDQTHRI